jgi:APA family basic amino acid/polyamine antiporter
MVLFMFVAYVVLGASKLDWILTEQPSLQAVAAQFMNDGQVLFFSIAGGVFAIATTINSVFWIITSAFAAVADDRVLPSILSKKNRFGVEIWTIWIVAAIVVALLLLQPPLDALVSAFGVANMIIFGVLIIPMFAVEKKFPKSYAKAIIKPSKPVLIILAVLAGAMALWQILSVAINTPYVILILVVVYAVFYAYFFVRVYWMKSKGFDLIAKMREVPKEWADQEAADTPPPQMQ